MQTHIKWLSAIALATATVAAGQTLAATELTGCAAKREAITTEIQQAQGNTERVAGLEKALDEVNAHCRDSTLVRQRNRKVIRAQVKVNEAERALHKAEFEQRPEKKLEKLRAKLARAQAELDDAEAALKQ